MAEHPSGQCGPMPEDPFPDLTLITLPGTTIRNGDGELIQLIAERVAAAEITARDSDGEATRVRIL